MSFDLKLTQFLTGVTEYQLKLWSKEKILVPEINSVPPIRYSFRDIVALRIVAKYPVEVSLWSLEENDYEKYGFAVEDVYLSFTNAEGKKVPDLQRSAPGIEIDAEILGGTPRVAGSRIPAAVIAEILRDPETTEQEIQEFYPNLKTADFKNVRNFDSVVYGAV